MRQLVYKVYFTRNQVPLYFWGIRPTQNVALFHCIISAMICVGYGAKKITKLKQTYDTVKYKRCLCLVEYVSIQINSVVLYLYVWFPFIFFNSLLQNTLVFFLLVIN